MLRRPLALALLLLTTTLVGCIGAGDAPIEGTATEGPVKEVLHDLGLVAPVELALPDGAVARGTVYIPDVAEGETVPTLLDLGPYYDNLGPSTDAYTGDHPAGLLYEHFLRQGYAVAMVSLRGTGLSEGCFKIGGPEEWADAAAIVEGLADQPWSDGTVAMTGVSYDGTTPWEAAVMAPPSLKAIVPVEGITDMYRYSFYEGAVIWGGPLFNTYYPAYVDVLYTGNDHAAHAANQPTNVCTETAQGMAEDHQTYADGVHDAFWDARDTQPHLGDIEAATFVVHGFQDWNVKMDHVQTIWDELPEPRRMLLGQWEHNIPWSNTFEEDWSIPWYNATVTTWLDAHVRGDPMALAALEELAPVSFQDSRGTWHNVTAWPPADHGWTVRNVSADGALTTQAPADGTLTFHSQPLDDQGQDERLPTQAGPAAFQAVFTGEAPGEPTWLVGNPWLNLSLEVALPTGGQLTAILYDVGGEEPFMVTKGHLNLAQREGRDKTVDVPTGEVMALSIPLYAIAHVLEPGHHLELVIEGEDHEGWAESTPRQQVFTLHQGALALPTWVPGASVEAK